MPSLNKEQQRAVKMHHGRFAINSRHTHDGYMNSYKHAPVRLHTEEEMKNAHLE